MSNIQVQTTLTEDALRDIRVTVTAGNVLTISANGIANGETPTLAQVLGEAGKQLDATLVVGNRDGSGVRIEGQYYVVSRDANGASQGKYTSDPDFPVPAGSVVSRQQRVSNG